MTTIEDVLSFWFEEAGPENWYAKDERFDEKLRRRFGDAYLEAAAGRYDTWRNSARGCVALCILLDQFPRNMFRGSPQAYATDHLALYVARHALERELDRHVELADAQRRFLYTPFQHSEDLNDQHLCVRLAKEHIEDNSFLDYAEQHLRVIERFGRFPHRNAILGRPSTPQELDYLSQEGSSF